MSLDGLQSSWEQNNKKEISSINEILMFAKGYLQNNGIESYELDARVLFSHVYKLPMTRLLVSLHEEMRVDHRYRQFAELVNRRGKGCPTAYLTGEKEFYSLMFTYGVKGCAFHVNYVQYLE